MAELPIKSISVEAVVAQRDAIVEALSRAHAEIQKAREIASSLNAKISGNDEYRKLLQAIDVKRAVFDYHARRSLAEDDGVDRATRHVDHAIWDLLMHESGMMDYMDEKARDEWHARDENEEPPVTEANVRATFASVYESRDEMFERGVIRLFRSLSWDYKTNQPVSFGRKIILENVFDWHPYGPSSLSYAACEKIDDMIRIFSLLDGKPPPDYRHKFRHTFDFDEPPIFDYFQVRWFKKGTMHFTFTRPDLVEKMNKILARHYPGVLPQARARS